MVREKNADPDDRDDRRSQAPAKTRSKFERCGRVCAVERVSRRYSNLKAGISARGNAAGAQVI